uniref:Uncharacterized protein n=1 Tax=viral metagenome TaxID=1070528 RepID=A0A6M3M4Z2_9ZZZZ
METKEATLNKAIQETKAISRTIIESGQEHQPTLLILTPTEGINTLIGWVDKENFKEVVSQLLHHFHAYAYIFINEAWTAHVDKNSPLAQEIMSGRKKISELPLDDKDEILMIMAAENGKSYRSWAAKIRYTREDKRYLDEWMEDEGVADGRMVLKEW